MKCVAIIGGGISGLAATYDLANAGFDCTLIEARSRLGGVIQTERVANCVVEDGPDSFLAQKPWALELIRELGLEDQVIGSNDHLRKTFVLRAGKLIPLPDGVQFMVPTRIGPMLTTPLLGWGAKAKMALEWFRQPGEARQERSVADFVRDHFGEEVNRYLAQPMLAGVYGGSPESLSVNAVLPRFVELEEEYGSVSRGMLRAASKAARRKPTGGNKPPSLFLSLKGGMQQLTDLLAEKLEGRVRRITGSAEALTRNGGGFRFTVNGDTVSAYQVVIATAAHAAAGLLEGLDSHTAEHLKAIPYSSSLTVNLLYQRPPFEHALKGFGFLAPEVEQAGITACTWVNTKFPHRGTNNYALLRAFLADRQAEASFDVPDDEIARRVHGELSRIMGLETEPAAWRVARWKRAMAQYEVGHRKRIQKIEQRLSRIGGLYLAGNAYEGIGIPDCIRRSREIARKIRAHAAGQSGTYDKRI